MTDARSPDPISASRSCLCEAKKAAIDRPDRVRDRTISRIERRRKGDQKFAEITFGRPRWNGIFRAPVGPSSFQPGKIIATFLPQWISDVSCNEVIRREITRNLPRSRDRVSACFTNLLWRPRSALRPAFPRYFGITAKIRSESKEGIQPGAPGH